MSTFAERCGIHSASRRATVLQTARVIDTSGADLVRVGWCDLHGVLRGKTLTARAAGRAMRDGLGMVSTLLLKDTSDRTVYKVFEPGGLNELPGFEFANNLVLLPEPESFKMLPWAPRTGWLRAQPWFQSGEPVMLDTRRQLQQALSRLAEQGLGMVCGLEVEFHIYRIRPGGARPDLDPDQAGWPGLPPEVDLIHPGYNLLAESWADLSDEPLRIVQQTAQDLGLPLQSLEIELGPSQVEAVFDATDALTAADNMVLFRNGVRQALRRAGYHATFMCRPPFAQIMSSGWHLHQSLVHLSDRPVGGVRRPPNTNAFMRASAAPGTTPSDALHTLSATGAAWLAGLLAHAPGMTALCTPTVNGFGRFRPNALAPQAILWGRDNRGAMLRVIGAEEDPATRIENRLGEPVANPYLYMAAQIHAGLDGIARGLMPPPATESPYDPSAARIPSSLPEALAELQADRALVNGFGEAFVRYFTRVKSAEQERHAAAKDKLDFERREYFSRY